MVPVPAVFYTPETEFGAGIGIVHAYRYDNDADEVPDSSFIPALIYTQRDQLIGRALFEHYSQRGQYYWNAAIAYTRYPDRFYGVGGKTSLEDEELFTEVYGSCDISISRRVISQTYIGPMLRYEEFSVRDRSQSGQLITDQISGSNHGIISGLGLRLVHNTRDNAFVPRNGRIIEFSLIQHSEKINSTFNFASASTRYRHYWSISPNLVVAGDLSVEDRRGDVPFRKFALLGGQYLLRGIFLGRYRDSKLAATQFDVRKMMGNRFGFVLFASTGWVGHDWQAIAADDFHTTYGAGVRFILDEQSRINLRIDYGIGTDSNGVYMGVGEAF